MLYNHVCLSSKSCLKINAKAVIHTRAHKHGDMIIDTGLEVIKSQAVTLFINAVNTCIYILSLSLLIFTMFISVFGLWSFFFGVTFGNRFSYGRSYRVQTSDHRTTSSLVHGRLQSISARPDRRNSRRNRVTCKWFSLLSFLLLVWLLWIAFALLLITHQ